MQKKERADWVFFNVSCRNNDHEAIAIYKGIVIDMGSIPYIFNNYRGFKDFNAQGNFIMHSQAKSIEIGKLANGIFIYTGQNKPAAENIIWEIRNEDCIIRNTNLLDPHWDDH